MKSIKYRMVNQVVGESFAEFVDRFDLDLVVMPLAAGGYQSELRRIELLSGDHASGVGVSPEGAIGDLKRQIAGKVMVVGDGRGGRDALKCPERWVDGECFERV